jgi:hypothetical protein
MSTYRIVVSKLTVMEQDEQYIRMIDQTDPLLYGQDYSDGETPYFKGPSSDTWFKCEVVDE